VGEKGVTMFLYKLLCPCSKEYVVGINNTGEVITRKLNPIQIILRSVFGLYKETHLRPVTLAISNRIAKEGIIFNQDAGLKARQLFEKRMHMQTGGLEDKISFFKYTLKGQNRQEYHFNCSLESPNSCRLEVQGKSTVYLKVEAKDVNSLKVTDILFNPEFKQSGLLYSQFHRFLFHVLHHSPKVQKIYWENVPEILNMPRNNCVQEQEPSGKIWTVISRPREYPNEVHDTTIPPLSLDFLLQFSEEQK
jgi:hypothetical protein